MTDVKRHRIEGERYRATVPDTLDLVDRAELAINSVTGLINTKQDYEFYWRMDFAPPSVFHHACEWFDSTARVPEVLALLRIVTGTDHNLDIEEKVLESLLSRMGDDGLIYNAPYREDAPWRSGGREYCRPGKWRTDEDVTEIHMGSWVAIGLMERYQRDGDPAHLEMAGKLIDALIELAIHRDDYAYYPANSQGGLGGGGLEFAYYRESGWPNTIEAESELDNAEGSVTCYIAIIIRGLSRWYALTGDERALETARKLTNYVLKPRFWLGNIENWGGDERSVWSGHGGAQFKPAALFKGHLTGITITLHGLIDYALVANDVYVKRFARQGYEYMRNLGLSCIGMWGENVGNGLMAAIAIKLSDAGVGDYWEDVDQYIRNTMVEDQFVGAKLLRQACDDLGVPAENGEFTIERFLGCLRLHGLLDGNGTLDPTQNGTVSAGPYEEPFYFVWEGITRYTHGLAQINLLLNRASPWLDIDSYLPYSGKVVIKNKTAKTVAVRIPTWVDRSQLSCRVGEFDETYHWVGNYVLVSGLGGGEVITLGFPMVERTEHYTLVGVRAGWRDAEWLAHEDSLPQYDLHFKGNTCVQVDFTNRDRFVPDSALERGPLYPVYRREHYRESVAPMKEVTRFVARRLADW